MKKYTLVILFMLLTTCLYAASPLNGVRISECFINRNTGAGYDHSYITLFNSTTYTVNVSGGAVETAFSLGSYVHLVTNLTGSIAAHSFYLIQFGPTLAGTALPTPDLIETATSTGWSHGNGLNRYVLLLDTQVDSACADPNVVDAVGFGLSPCFQGTASSYIANLGANSMLRTDLCLTTNNNTTDFSSIPANPRNSSSSTWDCSVPSATPTSTFTPTPSFTDTPQDTETDTPTPVDTDTASPTATPTETPSVTLTVTSTSTSTATATPSPTATFNPATQCGNVTTQYNVVKNYFSHNAFNITILTPGGTAFVPPFSDAVATQLNYFRNYGNKYFIVDMRNHSCFSDAALLTFKNAARGSQTFVAIDSTTDAVCLKHMKVLNSGVWQFCSTPDACNHLIIH